LTLFFDTSFLIPAFYKFHVHHVASARLVLSATKENSFCALRTIGEMYAVLTGLPIRPRISGLDAMAIVQQILDRMTVVTLTEEEYIAALHGISATVIGGRGLRRADCTLRCQGLRRRTSYLECS